jgi:ectoine hydroxylase-related dioxygenase (phytanoyl-CoA dioxygenase family)
MNATISIPKLKKSDIEQFKTKGFVSLKDIIPAAEIKRIEAIYDQLFKDKVGYAEGSFFDLAGNDDSASQYKMPQLLGPSKYSQELKDSIIFPILKEAAKQLLSVESDDAIRLGDHAILKPAKNMTETPWHQDEAYWDETRDHNALSFWIPLQKTDYNNGTMCFIPLEKNQEIIPHHTINNDPKIHGLEVDSCDKSKMVVCPLNIGDITAHHNKTLHYTPPNITDSARKAYIIVAQGPSTPLNERRNYYWNRSKQTARAERQKENNAILESKKESPSASVY